MTDIKNLFGGMRNPIPQPSVEFYESNSAIPSEKWRWRLKYMGHIVAASSEGYANRADAVSNFKRIEDHIAYLRKNDLIK